MDGLEANWSLPDDRGITTLDIDIGAKSTLRGKRLRRAHILKPTVVQVWPATWRGLAADWLIQCGDSERTRWDTFLRIAGEPRVEDASGLVVELLAAGFLEIEEHRAKGQWQLRWIHFRNLSELRQQLGLPDLASVTARIEAFLSACTDDPRFSSITESLALLSPLLAAKRIELVDALRRWLLQERTGTEREFAYFSRGDTKAISASEWKWLREHIDLSSVGIDRHKPSLWLRAKFVAKLENDPGRLIDFGAFPDFLGVTPQTIDALGSIDRQPSAWRLIENRTNFEKACAAQDSAEAVLWVPGWPAPWWKTSVLKLLRLAPVPAHICCDPDPAGIQIAIVVAKVWEEAGLAWDVEGMGVDELRRLEKRKALTMQDRRILDRLLAQNISDSLKALANEMIEKSQKGEQEGLLGSER